MTDRELLELAAKAAGIAGFWVDAGLNIGSNASPEIWNPLKDYGDGLRLAVKLKINIEHMETMGRKQYGANCWPVGRGDCGAMELPTDDYGASVLRAIVRAAAAIGESMP